MFRGQIKWVCDYSVFRTFYLIYLFSLRLDRHVFVNDTDSALSRHRDRHAVLGYRIHAGTHKWNIELDFLCQVC